MLMEESISRGSQTTASEGISPSRLGPGFRNAAEHGGHVTGPFRRQQELQELRRPGAGDPGSAEGALFVVHAGERSGP